MDYKLHQKPAGFKRAEMFNRKAAQARKRSDLILSTLALQPGQFIADLGAGGGYFSFQFAKVVAGSGRVYAIDIEPDFLAYIQEQARIKQIMNLMTVPVSDIDHVLPDHALDWLFLRNVFHHLDNRILFLDKFRKYMKPDGRAAIIEHKPGITFFDLRRPFGHYVKPEKIVQEMTEAGYRFSDRYQNIPGYSFLIFDVDRQANR